MNNVAYVLPICEYESLAEIYCTDDDIKKNLFQREIYFINKKGKIVAHFKSNSTFFVEQLTQKRDDLFVIDYADGSNYNIVQFLNDTNYTLIKSCENIEFGVEDGCFAIKQNGLWGFINEDAEEIIKPQYKDYCAFSGGLAAVQKNDKWGFINKQNEVVIPFEYEIPQYSSFNGNYAPVGKNGKFGFIDKLGNNILPFKYESAINVFPRSKIFPVKANNKWGFVDCEENMIIPFEFDEVECNADRHSVYSVMKQQNDIKLYGLVDAKSNKMIVPCDYLSLCPNQNSIQAQKQNGKYVLLNWNGEEISEEHDVIDEYCHGGLYIIKNGSKEGYLNENGTVEIPTVYEKCKNFYGGFAVVKNNDCSQVINRANSVIIKAPKYDEIFNVGAGFCLLEKEGLINIYSKIR